MGRPRTMGKKAKNAGSKNEPKESKGADLSEQFQKELMQQQEKISQAAIKLENMAERKEKQERELRRCILSAKEVDTMTDGSLLYRQYGRMFLNADKEELLDQLEVSAKKSQKEVKTVEDTMVYFEKQRAEAETNLREMMAQLEKQMAAQEAA